MATRLLTVSVLIVVILGSCLGKTAKAEPVDGVYDFSTFLPAILMQEPMAAIDQCITNGVPGWCDLVIEPNPGELPPRVRKYEWIFPLVPTHAAPANEPL